MTTTTDLFALFTWPFEAMKLGTDLAETMVRAQSVISARLPVMRTALADPLNADHRELGRMVTEKVSAFRSSGESVEKAGGVARDAAAVNWKAFRTVASGGLIWPSDWIRLVEANLAAASVLATLPATAFAPIHQGVVANDRRLRGSKTSRAR